MAAGNGISTITDLSVLSYNRAINSINQFTKSKKSLLELAYNSSIEYTDKLNNGLSEINRDIANLKYQIYINQSILDNIKRNPPYMFPINLIK